MTKAEDVARNLVFDKVKSPLLISYSLKNNANGDSWKEIKVVFNGSKETQTVNVGNGDWKVIAATDVLRPKASTPPAADVSKSLPQVP